MNTRFEFNGTTLRLFVSEDQARKFASPFNAEAWTPFEFECGWLLRTPTGIVHDAFGPVTEMVSQKIIRHISAWHNTP